MGAQGPPQAAGTRGPGIRRRRPPTSRITGSKRTSPSTATRLRGLGITMQTIDDALYDAFGQRFVATTYTQLNQYHIVMTVPQEFWQNPNGLQYIYVKGAGGIRVPLSTFCKFTTDTGPLAVNHSGVFPSVTISFNLPPGGALGDAVDEIDQAIHELGLPSSLHGRFQGAALAFQDSL